MAGRQMDTPTMALPLPAGVARWTITHRAIPLAVATLLLGLPLMAEGVVNPPTPDEVKEIGRQSPLVSDYLSQGELIQGPQLERIVFLNAKRMKDSEPTRFGFIDESGLWALTWHIRLKSGQVVTIVQWIEDRGGKVLMEEVFAS
jgi:hypothetical protein